MIDENPEITYERWYPDVPAVMDTKQLAAMLGTNEQIVPAMAHDGVIPSQRPPGGRKFKFLRHEIFAWLVENRYTPGEDTRDPEIL